MAQFNLTQAEANALLAMEKHRVSDNVISFSYLGQSENIELLSADKSEIFLLDLSRGSKSLSKIKLQNRARESVILVRLDLEGPNHRNPDGTYMATPHLHVYSERFGSRLAIPVPQNRFYDLSDEWRTLQDFMCYCKITKPPLVKVQRSLPI